MMVLDKNDISEKRRVVFPPKKRLRRPVQPQTGLGVTNPDTNAVNINEYESLYPIGTITSIVLIAY